MDDTEITLDKFFALLVLPVYGPELPKIICSYEVDNNNNNKNYALNRFNFVFNKID